MSYIGNTKSKELHLDYCPWSKLMSEEHIQSFSSLEDAIAAGYDPCGHCQPFTREDNIQRDEGKYTASFPANSNDSPTKRDTQIRRNEQKYTASFLANYNGSPTNWDTQIHRNEQIELEAKIGHAAGEPQGPLEGKSVKFAIVYHAGREYALGTAISDTNGTARLTHTFPDNISTCSLNLVAYFGDNVEPNKISRYAAMYDMIAGADFSPKKETNGNTYINFNLDAPMTGIVKIYRRLLFIFWQHKKSISWEFSEKGPARITWNGRNEKGKKTWGVFKAVIEADTWPIPGFDKLELQGIKRKK